MVDFSVEGCKREARSEAIRLGADPRTILALITVESTWQPFAMRHEPGFAYVKRVSDFAKLHGLTYQTELYAQRTSWGLLQIMGGTARDLGYVDHIAMLMIPQVGLEWGIRYFLDRCKRYTVMEDQIAAYNAGSARKDSLTGRYINQKYVDKVLNALL